MKERDLRQSRIRFYPKPKARRIKSYGKRGVCDVSSNDAKHVQNKVTKKNNFEDPTKSKLNENENIPDSSICDGTDNPITNEKVIKKDRLDNGYLMEKEVYGDKTVNYHLDKDGKRIMLPGWVYTTKNDLREDERTDSDLDENVESDRSVSNQAFQTKFADACRNNFVDFSIEVKHFEVTISGLK